jgi:hypothetical protein
MLHMVSAVDEGAVASFDGPAVWLAVVALACFGAGGYALWKGATLQDHEDANQSYRRTRRKWIFAGVGCIAFGLIAVWRIGQPEE